MGNLATHVSKNLDNYIMTSNIARAIAQEMVKINNSKIFSNYNGIGVKYPIVTYFFNYNDISESGKEFLKQTDCQDNFCFFDEKESTYKIYIAGHSFEFLKKYYNTSDAITFRGKRINIDDNLFEFAKQIALSAFRHELGHIKITEIEKKDAVEKAQKLQIPFYFVNLLEDVRVNSYWDDDAKNYRVIDSELLKIQKEVLQSTATGYDILFPVCVTKDDPKYTYLSPDYPFVKNIYCRAQLAKSLNEIVDLCEEFFNEMQKRHPQISLNQPNSQPQQNQQQGQQNDDGSGGSSPSDENGNKSTDKRERGDNNSSVQDIDPTKRFGEDDGDFEEDYDEEIDSSELQSNRREISQTEQNDNFLNDSNNAQSGGDLTNAMLSEEKLNTLRNFLESELEKKSYKIDENGNLSKPKQGFDGMPTKRFSPRSEHVESNNNIALLPSAHEVDRGFVSLNTRLLDLLVNSGKKELSKFFPQTKMVKSKDITHHVNIQNLFSIPVNPQLENIFLKKGKPNPKEPIKISIFQDLSGSMGGSPLNISKHIIAALKKLQDLGYIDVTMFFHANISGDDTCHVVNLGKLKQNPLERISALETGIDEGIINALSYAKQKHYTTLKNSRFVLFMTDACLCDKPKAIKRAFAKLGLQKCVGIYADIHESSNNLDEYFENNISFNIKNAKDGTTKTQQISELILKTICTLANPDITAQQAVRILSKEKDIVAHFGKKQNVVAQQEEIAEKNTSKVKL
ncbi:vWA domain-containing protein [Campylobacter sp. JMF_03 NE3]|uniref:vWA domain-containing protein n=1 Tax=Campylobacter sp. JMF_03 NE3 TaxID=2983831 RepID=UPI0022E9E305|nr:vWA domain-containing protein [Campylobacter sp. JMF_03 NE3]MDA3053602.1 VWA domain-containing protein [Campylobacter sp. JMF_03 NE3]